MYQKNTGLKKNDIYNFSDVSEKPPPTAMNNMFQFKSNVGKQ